MPARILTAEDAGALIRPTDTIGMGLGPAHPPEFLAALSQRTDWENLTIGGALVLGLFEVFTRPNVHYRCGFFGPAERAYRQMGGDVQLVPAGFRQFGPILRRTNPRVMIAHATPPDYRGMVNLSLHHGGTYAELRLAGQDPARLLMIETSPYLPRTRALDNYPNEIHVDEIDVLIEGEARPPELPPETRTEVDHAIAELAASFVTDDATLQTGIGGVPSIVAENLAARAGATFGVHTEMFTDGLWKLHLAGKVRNQAKGLYEGISVATFALGGRGLYDWLDGNEEVAFGPVSVVNDPAIIGANNHLVAINGGLQVDLFGQVVADYVGGRQISGVGGHEDFVAGTDLTPGTVTLICLPSTAQVGAETVSRVVSELPAGSIVSTPRHHAPVVITEFGAADLRDCTVHERATRLAEVAHPDFRADLRAAAELLR